MARDTLRELLTIVADDPQLHQEMLGISNQQKLAKWLVQKGKDHDLKLSQSAARDYASGRLQVRMMRLPEDPVPVCHRNDPTSYITTNTSPISRDCGPNDLLAALIRVLSPRLGEAFDQIALNENLRTQLSNVRDIDTFRNVIGDALRAQQIPADEIETVFQQLNASLDGGRGPA